MTAIKKTDLEILQEMGDRYQAVVTLEEVSKIVYLHPEWLEQEPRLKDLIKLSA